MILCLVVCSKKIHRRLTSRLVLIDSLILRPLAVQVDSPPSLPTTGSTASARQHPSLPCPSRRSPPGQPISVHLNREQAEASHQPCSPLSQCSYLYRQSQGFHHKPLWCTSYPPAVTLLPPSQTTHQLPLSSLLSHPRESYQAH